ncbi:MAG: hypothetical protein CL910_01355 [Deltaproteobacteria bacterium]|jgi:HlyD family secretion protein|nr:hypothetical protein [Deltaproteobacteria bacterium]
MAPIERAPALALATSLVLAACGGDPVGVPSVGTLERDRIELVAESDDPIAEIAVREGDSVEAGQLVLRLDPARVDAQVARAAAARDQAAARVAEATRGPRPERIVEARAALAGARSAAQTAQRELERVEALAEVDVASRSRLDVLRASADEARARKDQARATLDAMLEGTTVEELDQAHSGLAAAEATLLEGQVRRSRLDLLSPAPGRVDALPYEPGERPRPGSVVAVLLAEQAPYARIHVPESVRVHVAPGTVAQIRVEGLDRVYAGRLRQISHEAAFTPYYALTRYDRGRLVYLAEVELTEPAARELPSGVPVEVVFDSGAGNAD